MPCLNLAKGVGTHATTSTWEQGSRFDSSLPRGKSGCSWLRENAINMCDVSHGPKTELSQAEKRWHPDLKNSQSAGYGKREIFCLLL